MKIRSNKLTASKQPQARPLIVPVFIPHQGCPHQCVFCNQRAITGKQTDALDLAAIRQQIDTFLQYRRRYHTLVQISYFGGSFLGLGATTIGSLLDLATEYHNKGLIDSIRFSTRPDTITQKNLTLLKPYPVTTVELGVQSMNDKVLSMTNRGHEVNDTLRAVSLLKVSGYQIGLQMMVGLPGDTPKSLMETTRSLISLKPDFIRIYPTLVLAGSPLAKCYQEGHYQPLGLSDGVDLVSRLYLLFQENQIPVVRMGLQASKELDNGASVLAGPYHPAFGHLVHARIFLDHIRSLLQENGNLYGAIQIFVHPRNISRARGLGNDNIRILKKEFLLKDIAVLPDQDLGMDDVRLL